MTPQVLGNLTALAQSAQGAKQSALTAQQMAQNAANAAAANAAAIAQLKSPSGASQVVGGTPIIYSGTATSWKVQGFANLVPNSAKWVLLTGYAYNSNPDDADVELDFRSDVAGATILACKYRSVNGSYSSQAAINCWVPIASDGTIQYRILNGSFNILSVSVVGYM